MISRNPLACSIIFFLSIQIAHAQSVLPDSIQSKVGFVQDSSYVLKLNELASSYLGASPSVARNVATHALDVAQKIKYDRGYARALTVIGNSYWYEGIYEFAQNYYLLAARQYQASNDSIGLGQTYNNIGEVYKKLNEYEKALEYLLKSTELKKKDSSTHGITLYNIGELYIRLGQIEKGRRYIHESLEIARRDNNQRAMAFNYWSFAAIKEFEKNYPDALQYLFKAEKIWQQVGEKRSVVQTYQNISEVYRKQGRFRDAEQYLQKALALGGQIKVGDLQVRNYLLLSRLDSTQGRYDDALNHLSRHNQLKDSVYNLLKAEQIARLQTIYESESREQENQQLRTEKQIRDTQLESQKITLIAISTGLFIAGVLAWMLYRQQKKILFQKNAIEVQATALQKLNQELQQFNRNLEARITERTSQLTVQNQKLAEFTFLNAHKLRAPVASILGLVNLLQKVDDAERDMIIAHLKTCSEELDSVIREVSRQLEGAIVNDPHK